MRKEKTFVKRNLAFYEKKAGFNMAEYLQQDNKKASQCEAYKVFQSAGLILDELLVFASAAKLYQVPTLCAS